MIEKNYWVPAKAFRPESELAEKNIWHKGFTPTYEQEEPQMGLILSWHYGRQWLEERNSHGKETKKKIKTGAKFIPPDYSSWLEKRRINKTRQQLLKS
ncbi:uncharacterized protein [Drosophila takahashii]|uniref:uncharacterized protein n=1 Tax=Drosophila takahashii TaxID=29030 RepID=UPI0007E89E62|nr:uncharacterized protein LOC108066088 [Drosophila takahashii]KAH8344058.1 hypothetical protein KR084_003843 [Drosophila pseudotakahashii]